MKGISNILREAMYEIKRGNYSIKQKLLKISSKFVNGVEVSAQEAAYTLFGLHMTECSVGNVFINTFPKNKRVQMLKSKSELQNLDPSSIEIFRKNMTDYFRPWQLKKLCLADFIAQYEYSSINRQNNNSKYIKLNKNMGFVYKRNKAKIIRYRNYFKDTDPENFYREQITLFLPWKNEERDIMNQDCKLKYTQNFNVIIENHERYNRYSKYVESFDSEVRSLNTKQRRYLHHLMNNVNNKNIFHEMLVLVKALLYWQLINQFPDISDLNLDLIQLM